MEIALFALVAFVAFLCEYAAASIGMGYGTALTPLLLIVGFSPLQVVPAVLSGQLAGGVVGGIAHHKIGNINLDFRCDEQIKERLRGLGYVPKSFDSKVIFVLSICGAIGALIAVFTAVNIPQVILQSYIGVMVVAVGFLILLRRKGKAGFSWRNFATVALIASFNKGISGGGYGPLVTGGQIISGRDARSSIGSTTFAEAIVCAVAFLSYLLIEQCRIHYELALATSIGTVISAPIAALTVKKAGDRELKFLVGSAMVTLGALTLMKTFKG